MCCQLQPSLIYNRERLWLVSESAELWEVTSDSQLTSERLWVSQRSSKRLQGTVSWPPKGHSTYVTVSWSLTGCKYQDARTLESLYLSDSQGTFERCEWQSENLWEVRVTVSEPLRGCEWQSENLWEVAIDSQRTFERLRVTVRETFRGCKWQSENLLEVANVSQRTFERLRVTVR